MTDTRTLSRSTTGGLTAIAAALFLLLSGAFGSGLLTGPLWNGANWVNSPLITYLLVGLIVAAGIVQANRLSTSGLELHFPLHGLPPGQMAEPLLPRLLFGNVFWAVLAHLYLRPERISALLRSKPRLRVPRSSLLATAAPLKR